MEENPYLKYKLYTKIYDYSKKYISQKKLAKNFILLASNAIFVILAYLLVGLFENIPDKSPLYLTFLIIIALSSFLYGLIPALITSAIISLLTYSLLSNFTKAELDLTLYIQLASFAGSSIIVSFLIDLAGKNSEIKKLREQADKYAHTFIELHDEYTKALKDIKSRDEFLSMVSHELKTPLTVMLLNLHNMLISIKSMSMANFSIPRLMKVLKNSEQQIKRLTSMINDLLDISLITTGRMNLQLEDTDLVSITKQVELSFSELLKKERSKMKIDADSPVIGRWDKVRIEQVITNLLSNAIKYGESKPIHIKIFKSGNQGKLIIKDAGIGISPREQEAIFELFKRASRPEKYTKGLGVGLFITSQIIKMHGGKITVSSKPNVGTSFTIELPIKKSK